MDLLLVVLSIINFTLAVKSFYVSFSTFLAIESTYTTLQYYRFEKKARPLLFDWFSSLMSNRLLIVVSSSWKSKSMDPNLIVGSIWMSLCKQIDDYDLLATKGRKNDIKNVIAVIVLFLVIVIDKKGFKNKILWFSILLHSYTLVF